MNLTCVPEKFGEKTPHIIFMEEMVICVNKVYGSQNMQKLVLIYSELYIGVYIIRV